MKINEFIQLLEKDAELAKKLNASKSPDEAYAIAKAAGLSEGFDAFASAMEKLNKASTEMDAKDVDAITGGASTTEIVSAVTSSVGAAASAAGAAAAV